MENLINPDAGIGRLSPASGNYLQKLEFFIRKVHVVRYDRGRGVSLSQIEIIQNNSMHPGVCALAKN